jgi:hypothetical protein
MYLLDTNIWLERMLDQARLDEVGRLLDQVPSDQLLMTDFTFHSIGVILHRLNRRAEFLRFVQDVFIDGAVSLISLEPADMERLVAIVDRFGLDFDGTERERITPAEIGVDGFDEKALK